MAFIVEDGTGVDGATSYATVDYFRTHHTDRGVSGVDSGTLSDSVVQGLMVAATDYINTRWGPRLKGRRRWLSLLSRSVLTLTAVPGEGEAVVFGDQTYTFRASPTLTNDVQIGASALVSLQNLASSIAQSSNDDWAGSEFADPDAAALTVFAAADGVTTTETLTDGAWDNAATDGKSARRQPLEFPRSLLRDREGQLVVGIPAALKQATAEYALRANTAALAPDPTVDATGGMVTMKRDKVGPIETELQFAEGVALRITKPYPAADRLLQEFIRSAGVIRA